MPASRAAAPAAQVETGLPRLDGYLGPFYPHRVHTGSPSLGVLYADKLWDDNITVMVGILRAVPQFTRLAYNRATSDGYPWRFEAIFTFEGGEVVVLFPHISGHGNPGRPIAFYAKGVLGQAEIDLVSNILLHAFAS